MNKHLILLIATVLLIVSLISADTLGWFEKQEKVFVESINVSIESLSSVDVTADNINYVVPTGYSTGLAPGCLGYFGLNLSNEEGSSDAYVTVSVDFSITKVPSNLQFYKDVFNTSDTTLPTDNNTKWSSDKYVQTDNSSIVELCKNVKVSRFDSKVIYVAFFWPYSSPDNNVQDTQYGIKEIADFVIHLNTSSISS